ncbi:uncharacterized protein LOC120448391 isoform X2 [Drosophila santomea]|uniref:uncharacterized protein LOC120448391 isoform X2 n=1 Tax=Drosophila santomea TaxID=129105 RepID=UPI001CCBB34B|nr:uncharacterized protein LOC120448391 isoform X2 [Drosophila santomea]
MNANKRRSSLRKAPTKEDETTTTSAIKQQIKRRISFSGKKSVREFVNTKETNNWDDSYEVSENHAEDSSGSKCLIGSTSVAKVPEAADKENIPLRSVCERERVDLSVNLQNSVDFTLLSCEMMDKSRKTTSSAVSFCLSSEERKLLQISLSDRQLGDKTMDLMSGSLVNRIQIPPSVCEESSFKLPPKEREKGVHTPAVKAVSDSFMDITPLGFTDPTPSAPAHAAPAPVSAPAPVTTLYPPAQQSSMELEDDSIVREMREFTKNQTKTPAQKSLFIDIEETKNEKNGATGGVLLPLNVSNDRDRSPSNSFESLNSTMNFTRDESMLIPFDMISGKNISKKLNFRQLNEDLEAGKIQIFPNGPKTPTTDRKDKKNRFWRGLEEEAPDDRSPKKDIRSIMPRGALNFSENMTLSPTKTSPVRKDNEQLKVVDEKQKYRLSQADEMMLDNTNFLAHARLGDETQSRNTSKNSTRRETTYENPELNLEYPTLSQDFQPIPSSKPRKTDFVAEVMQMSQIDYPAIPELKTVPTRRTVHLNESMDHEATKSTYVRKEISVTTQETIYEKSTTNEQNTNQKHTGWAFTKTKRRETLLMQESMEEDIISPLKDLHIKHNAAPRETRQSEVDHTLYLAEALEETLNQSKMLPIKNVSPRNNDIKARKTLLLEEPMEEEMSSKIVHNSKRKTLHLAEPLDEEEVISDKHLSFKDFAHQKNKSKGRQTVLLEEPMEEELFRNQKNPPEFDLKRNKTGPLEYSQLNQGKSFTSKNKSKARQTLLVEEPMEEDSECNSKDPQTYNNSKPGEDDINKITKSRQTIRMSEPLEEDMCLPMLKNKSIVSQKAIDESSKKQRPKSRHTQLFSESIEEERIQEDLPAGRETGSARQQRFKPRQTLIMADPIEEDVGEPGVKSLVNMVHSNTTNSSTSKARHTLLMSEPIEHELTNEPFNDEKIKKNLSAGRETGSARQQRFKPRQTLIMAEPIEEDVGEPGVKSLVNMVHSNTTNSSTSKARHTLLMSEPIEHELTNEPFNDEKIKKNLSAGRETGSARQQRFKPRQTLIMAEPIEEDVGEPGVNSLANVVHSNTTGSSTSKARHTLLMSEPIEEVLTNDPLNEEKRKNISTNRTLIPRRTILMAEPIEEESNTSIADKISQSHYKSNRTGFKKESFDEMVFENPRQPTKPRQTLLMAEPIEEDVFNQSKDQPKPHTVPKGKITREHSRRHTLINAEPIEEDLDVRKPLENSKELSVTARIIQSFAEPIENAIFSITDQIAKHQFSESAQTLSKAERLKKDSEPANHLHQKPRNTLISHDSIQEDLRAEDESSSVGPLRSRCRQTLTLAEPIEEDMSIHSMTKQNNTNESQLETINVPKFGGLRNTGAKTRQTFHIPVPIEEDYIPHPQHNESKTVVKGRTTLLLSESIADVSAQHTGNSEMKSMGSKVSAEPITEDLVSKGPQLSQAVEVTLPRESLVSVAPSSRRRTVLLSEPMEEDEGSFGDSYPPIERQVSKKSEKPEVNINSPNESVQKEEMGTSPSARTHQSMAMSESMDFQSPAFRSRGPDFNAMTPGMSLTEFMDQEEICKTPIHKRVLMTSHRKKLSMYQPVPIDLEGDGTPKNPCQLKRLPTHLTPNLPESKKRHTHLFTNSNIDTEMEDDQDGAWGTTNIQMNSRANKSRRTFTVEQLDASVQPVRDYNPVVTELDRQGGLDLLVLPRKSAYDLDLEEKPITISDVHNYFQEQKEEQRKSSDRESGSSNDRTFKSYAATNSKFINLTGNTTIFAAAGVLGGDDKEQPHQIDNEQLSLVSTLAEETDDDDEEDEEQEQDKLHLKSEICEGQLNAMVKAGSEGSCRKCANCNQTLSETRFSSDSFILPPQKLWDFSKQQQRLRNIRQKPSWKDVNSYWEIEEEARLSRNQDSDDSMEQTRVEEEPTKWNKAALLEMCKIQTGQHKAKAKPPESFFTRLKRLLVEQQPNWIFDYQRKVSQQLIFYHRQLTTFRIVVNYRIEDLVDESTISVCSIELDNEVPTPKEQWSTREHFLNFHLSLRLPLNPADEIDGSDEGAFLKFLNGIDRRIADVKQKFHNVLALLAQKRAMLVREANRTIVRKIVRKCIEQEPVVRLEKISFLIEIGNIEDTSFTDILRPELHLFNENIQYLPKGIPFLEAFLTDPEQYLRK